MDKLKGPSSLQHFLNHKGDYFQREKYNMARIHIHPRLYLAFITCM